MIDETSVTGVAAVVGAGTMGGGIAADLANAGWNVHLLDVSRQAAEAGRAWALGAKPPLLFLPEYADRIVPGALGEAGEALARAEWIVEAVAESLEVKRSVLARVEAAAGPRALVTSNTSGLGLAAMSAHCAPAFRRRFFGTHFLNPPRYLKLLEVIPAAESDPALVAGFVRFAERVLGHRCVLARDTPGFLSTRLWIAHLLDTLHAAEESGVDVDTLDALTGPLIGRPKSATCRMADVVGLDILAAVAANQYAALPHDPLRDRLRLPGVVERLLAGGRTGEKAGAGFYKREGRAVLTLDPATMDYRPRRDDPVPESAALLRLPLRERLAAVHARRGEPWTAFLDALLDRLTAYAEMVGPEVAADVLAVDRAMRWGFGWEAGPFEIADARGATPPNYAGGTFRTFGGPPRPLPEEPEYIDLAALRAAGRTVLDSEEASLIDLGDGVFCLEFHTKMNALRPGSCAFLHRALERAARDGTALVLGNQGPHFSVGYDLTRLASAMERGDLASIDSEMAACQEAFLAIRYAPVPVVAAPHGFTLGGGCEVVLHCHAVHAAPETVLGLPEARAGVLPCGGGVKEVLLRLSEQTPDPLEAARRALAFLVLPENSAHAHTARKAGLLLRATDTVARNADRRLYEAKERARGLAAAGHRPPDPPRIPVAGAPGLAVLRDEIAARLNDGAYTEDDARIADRLAVVLCGGEGAAPGHTTERALLDLERAAFLDLCQVPATLARMRRLVG